VVPAAVLLLEVGLGGRLDATNVAENPSVTAITSIGYDHPEFLGEHLGAIALEKAGIMKTGVPCVTSAQMDESVRDVFSRHAAEIGTPLYPYGYGWKIEAVAQGFRYTSTQMSLTLPTPNLLGSHQTMNAATAVACLEHFPDLVIEADALAKGLITAEWPARLQHLNRG